MAKKNVLLNRPFRFGKTVYPKSSKPVQIEESELLLDTPAMQAFIKAREVVILSDEPAEATEPAKKPSAPSAAKAAK